MNLPVNFCEACGARLSADMRFCEACGQPVAVPPSEPPQVAPQTPSAPYTPPLAPPPKKLTSIFIGGGLLLMLALAGAGYYFWYAPSRSKEVVRPPAPPPPPVAESLVKPPIPATPPVPPPPTALAPGDLQYFYYINPKFHYIISFPRNLLVPQGIFPSGAGQRFLAPENRAVLTVWGEYLQQGDSLERLFQQIITQRTCTYKVCKADWFVVSGYLSDGRIFYRKTLYRDNMFKSFEITYEKEQKDLYDGIVTHLARTFENTRPVD